jgi:hypothetical protein
MPKPSTFSERRPDCRRRRPWDAVRDPAIRTPAERGAHALELPVLLEVGDEGAEVVEGHRRYS